MYNGYKLKKIFFNTENYDNFVIQCILHSC